MSYKLYKTDEAESEWIVARSYGDAVTSWRKSHEYEYDQEPDSLHLITDYDDGCLILPDALLAELEREEGGRDAG